MKASIKFKIQTILAVSVALLVFNLNAFATSTFGFNYWPATYDNNCLEDAYWSTAEPIIKADLDHISSLSGGIIRITFWPAASGFYIGWPFTDAWYEDCNRIPDFLELCSERNIEVIVCFNNSYLYAGNGNPGHRGWMDHYDTMKDFVVDSVIWMNGFIDAIENSSYANTVLYYDLQNEYDSEEPNIGEYARGVYDDCNAPSGKLGFSIMDVPEDVNDLDDQLGARNLDFIDFHSYPGKGFNSDPNYCYDHCATVFPEATVIMGESGYSCPSSFYEANQQTTVLSLANSAIAHNMPYYLGWMFWDNTPQQDDQEYGWGYDVDSPKNVMGGMSDLLNFVANPDMEIFSGGVPVYWSAGGTINYSFYVCGPDTTNAPTNSYHARIWVDSGIGPGTVWMITDYTEVSGGKKLYVNCYVRSNMSNLKIGIHEYDSGLNHLAYTESPSYTPASWAIENFLQKAGSWSLSENANTRYVVIGIVGYVSDSSAAALDVDTVSACER